MYGRGGGMAEAEAASGAMGVPDLVKQFVVYFYRHIRAMRTAPG